LKTATLLSRLCSYLDQCDFDLAGSNPKRIRFVNDGQLKFNYWHLLMWEQHHLTSWITSPVFGWLFGQHKSYPTGVPPDDPCQQSQQLIRSLHTACPSILQSQ
jgi:hypothetical protein